jgi:esterase/lipase superfamily enzyme
MGARVELAVPGSDATLGVIRHGHYGRPVIVFPSEAGRAEDFANNGMLGAVQDLVDAGRVSFFCVDSLDKLLLVRLRPAH